jgi:hypothetical protein
MIAWTPVVNCVFFGVNLKMRLSSICDHVGPIHFEAPLIIGDGVWYESGTRCPIASHN